MIIPGHNNAWGLTPSIDVDGWIEITDTGAKYHWRHDPEEEIKLRHEWKSIHGNKKPQTTRDMIFFSRRYKKTIIS